MNINISLEDNATENFSPEASLELKRRAEDMVKQLIKEARIIEAARRPKDGKAEITQIDVIRAALVPNLLNKKEKTGWKKILQALAPILSAIPGFIYPYHTTLTDVIIIIIFTVVSVLTYYLIED